MINQSDNIFIANEIMLIDLNQQLQTTNRKLYREYHLSTITAIYIGISAIFEILLLLFDLI